MTARWLMGGFGGESTADPLIVRPLLSTGQCWYTHFTDGVDAVSPRGLNPQAPLKTLAQAVTNAADGDIVVMLSNETVTATVSIGKKIAIVGNGSAAGVPKISLGANMAAGALIVATASAVELRDLRFVSHLQANSTNRILVTGTEFLMSGCRMECGGTDEGNGLTLSGADRARLQSCTFISVATLPTDLPKAAIVAGGALADVTLDGVVVSGGALGFSDQFAVDLSAGIPTRLKGYSLSLLLGADVKLHASWTGWLNANTVNGGGRVEF